MIAEPDYGPTLSIWQRPRKLSTAHCLSAAPVATAAIVAGQLGSVVVLPLGLADVTYNVVLAIKINRIVQRDCGARWNGGDLRRVRLVRVDFKNFATDGHPFASIERVAIVIHHLRPGAVVNDGLFLIETGTLFAFVGADGEAAKLDAFDGGPGLFLAAENFDAIKASVGKRL